MIREIRAYNRKLMVEMERKQDVGEISIGLGGKQCDPEDTGHEF